LYNLSKFPPNPINHTYSVSTSPAIHIDTVDVGGVSDGAKDGGDHIQVAVARGSMERSASADVVVHHQVGPVVQQVIHHISEDTQRWIKLSTLGLQFIPMNGRK